MTRVKNIVSIVKARKLQWYGHVKQSSLPVRAAVEGMIEGGRRRGRPKRRWRSDIQEWCGDDWSTINRRVRDRTSWKKMCKALIF